MSGEERAARALNKVSTDRCRARLDTGQHLYDANFKIIELIVVSIFVHTCSSKDAGAITLRLGGSDLRASQILHTVKNGMFKNTLTGVFQHRSRGVGV